MKDLEGSIEILRAVWGQGPGIHKRQADLDRYEVLIARVRPRVIVETGLYYGGSQIWFGQRVPHIINVELPDATRDPDNQTTSDYRANRWGLGEPPPNGHIVEGHSHEVYDEAAALARELAGDEPIMVVLDSNHDTETVYGEAILYGQLVTPGSYMVIEDGILHYLPQEDGGIYRVGNWFDGDPVLAIERFLLEQGDRWEMDMEVEDMFPTTTNPMGWLRRR